VLPRPASCGPPPPATFERPAFGSELSGRFRFRLMRRLGRGRYGAVFLARCLDAGADGAPPERVAVKVLSSASGAERALRRELGALVALRHPRVPRVYDGSGEGRRAFFAMDVYDGGSLRDRMLADARPDEDELWRLLEHLLEALAAAHQASILHLDVKPSNVLLDGGGGFALADFGISEAARAGGGGRARGTPGYAAPELRDGDFAALDARADLYGVGATAWSYASATDLARRERAAAASGNPSSPLPPLASVRPDLSPSLVWLVEGLLGADPEQRPGSAAEALAQLHGLAGRAEPPRASLGGAGEALSDASVGDLAARLVDPVARAACRDPGLRARIVQLAPGELLCAQGERSDCAFLLLRGALLVERDGRALARLEREGALAGELAALTGRARTASLYAEGPTFVCVLNAAQFERLVASNAALGVRLLRSMAERYAS
jgi:serine/threonine-protein kinase